MMGKACVLLVVLFVCHLGEGAKLCREIRRIGGKLVRRASYHLMDFQVFTDPLYNVSSDGLILGWEFLSGVNDGKFYLDVWERLAWNQYKLISKTPSIGKPAGLNEINLHASPIPVSLFSISAVIENPWL